MRAKQKAVSKQATWMLVGAAATIAAAQLAARRGAHLGLQQLTGKRPPAAA